VACYVSLNLLGRFTVQPSFPPKTDDFMTLDVSMPQGCFGTHSPRFTIGNAKARPVPPFSHSVLPESSFLNLDHPYLDAGDFNIHNAATDPLRLLSSKEETESAPHFGRSSDLGFTRLNGPRVYTRFPFSGTHRPSTIDLAFANPHIFPAFHSWYASSLPSTGSDHAPIVISLGPPTPHRDKHRPRWQEADWPGLMERIKNGLIPPPSRPPPPANSIHGSPRPSPHSQRQLKHPHPDHARPQGLKPGGPRFLPLSARSPPKPPEGPKKPWPPTPTE